MRASLIAVALLTVSAFPAIAGVSGLYVRPNGHLVQVSPCGKSFCLTSQTAPNKGRSVGQFTPTGNGQFTGKITDLSNGKTYSGKAKYDGKKLTVAGCVLGGLICKSEDWQQR